MMMKRNLQSRREKKSCSSGFFGSSFHVILLLFIVTNKKKKIYRISKSRGQKEKFFAIAISSLVIKKNENSISIRSCVFNTSTRYHLPWMWRSITSADKCGIQTMKRNLKDIHSQSRSAWTNICIQLFPLFLLYLTFLSEFPTTTMKI